MSARRLPPDVSVEESVVIDVIVTNLLYWGGLIILIGGVGFLIGRAYESNKDRLGSNDRDVMIDPPDDSLEEDVPIIVQLPPLKQGSIPLSGDIKMDPDFDSWVSRSYKTGDIVITEWFLVDDDGGLLMEPDIVVKYEVQDE